MRFTSIVSVLSAMLLLPACGGGEDPPANDVLSISPATDQTVQAGATTTYTISGLTDGQAYRVTLVVDDNIDTTGGGAEFVDADANGAADAGASENIALITKVNGSVIPGVKTFPGGMDNPAAPSGIQPVNGQITVEITGVAAGKVYPVAYENGGASTFLELDEGGGAVENYGVGGGLTVSGASGNPVIIPNVSQTLAIDATVDYAIHGLRDEQAYRVTLVLADNATVSNTTGTFVDANADGAADAGLSENVAVITAVNGAAVAETKTVPAATDDPASPTGVFPAGGKITVTVRGVAPGKVYPVAYYNGGESTFLEVDASGAPVEVYSIGGSIAVQ
jgi:hypothetical protein